MSRLRALVLFVVLLALAATGCAGGASTELSDPAVRPGLVGGAAPDAPEPAGSSGAETPPPGGFVLELPEDSLPSGPPPATDDGALGGPPVDVALVRRSIDTVAAQSHRFEVRFAMSIDAGGQSMAISPAGPLATGETDGSRQRTLVDLGVMLDAFAADLGGGPGGEFGGLGDPTALLGDDLTIETVVDGTTIYVRAPMLGLLSAFGGDDLPGGLAELGDGWGMVDLTTVPGLSADDIAALTGAQGGSSPEQILALLDDLGSLTEVGPSAIDGDATTLYRTVIDVEAAIAAGVAEFDALGPLGTADIGSIFGDGPVIDLFVDEAGDLRRIVLALTGTEPSGGGSFALSTTVDVFDHGAGIAIAVPDDAVDLTDAFAELAALGDGPI